MQPEDLNGADLWRGALDRAAQASLRDAIRAVIAAAPLVRPVTRWGRPMSVRMSSAGRWGWVIRRGRYGYAPTHPETGRPWPAIPDEALAVWRRFSGWPRDPDSLLINWYAEGARMGMHQDADEGDFDAPVLSASLGDAMRFRIGGAERGGKTVSTILESGDVLRLAGRARLAFHGVEGLRFGSGDLLPGGGRLNLTFRALGAGANRFT